MNTSFLTKGLKKIEGHLVPSEKTQTAFKEIYDLIKPKSIAEIGFNAGHSAYMTLMLLPEVKLYSIDICIHPYSKVNGKKLEEMFPDRFRFTNSDSKNVHPHEIRGIDVLFIDGDHSIKGLTSDLKLASQAEVDWILVDDYHGEWFRSIIELVDHFVKKEDFNYTLVRTWNYDSRDGENTVALLKRIKQ